MDDADSGLEGRPQSVRHPVQGQGAGMNTSYTVNLTPPFWDVDQELLRESEERKTAAVLPADYQRPIPPKDSGSNGHYPGIMEETARDPQVEGGQITIAFDSIISKENEP